MLGLVVIKTITEGGAKIVHRRVFELEDATSNRQHHINPEEII